MKPGKTALIIMLRTLINECTEHNQEYHHVTPEVILIDAQTMIRELEQV